MQRPGSHLLTRLEALRTSGGYSYTAWCLGGFLRVESCPQRRESAHLGLLQEERKTILFCKRRIFVHISKWSQDCFRQGVTASFTHTRGSPASFSLFWSSACEVSAVWGEKSPDAKTNAAVTLCISCEAQRLGPAGKVQLYLQPLSMCLESRPGRKGIFPTSLKWFFMAPWHFPWIAPNPLPFLQSVSWVPSHIPGSLVIGTVPFQIMSFFFKPTRLFCSGSSEFHSNSWARKTFTHSLHNWYTIMLEEFFLTKSTGREWTEQRIPPATKDVWNLLFICTLKENAMVLASWLNG